MQVFTQNVMMSEEYSRDNVLIDLQSNDTRTICNALLGIAFYEPDWQWAQNKCLAFLQNNDPNIKRISATCLGHIARIHQKLDKDTVISVLTTYLNSPNAHIQGSVSDALDDIAMFIKS